MKMIGVKETSFLPWVWAQGVPKKWVWHVLLMQLKAGFMYLNSWGLHRVWSDPLSRQWKNSCSCFSSPYAFKKMQRKDIIFLSGCGVVSSDVRREKEGQQILARESGSRRENLLHFFSGVFWIQMTTFPFCLSQGSWNHSIRITSSRGRWLSNLQPIIFSNVA